MIVWYCSPLSKDKLTTRIMDVCDIELTETEKEMIKQNEKEGIHTEIACHFCGIQFDVKKSRALQTHIAEMHVVGESNYLCGICCEEFSSRKEIENHMSTLHRTPKPLGCGICGETFRLRNIFLKHIQSHSSEEIEKKTNGLCYCGECFEFFESVSLLQTHINNHKEVPIFVCAVCGLQTQHRQILVKHLETHVISSILSTSESVKSEGNIESNESNDNTGTTAISHHHTDADNFPQPIHVDVHRIDEETISDNIDTLDLVSSLRQETNQVQIPDSDNLESQESVLPNQDASYKCGVCYAFFTSLADALTHAGTHQDAEGTMQQVEINVLMENIPCNSNAITDQLLNDVNTDSLDLS